MKFQMCSGSSWIQECRGESGKVHKDPRGDRCKFQYSFNSQYSFKHHYSFKYQFRLKFQYSFKFQYNFNLIILSPHRNVISFQFNIEKGFLRLFILTVYYNLCYLLLLPFLVNFPHSLILISDKTTGQANELECNFFEGNYLHYNLI